MALFIYLADPMPRTEILKDGMRLIDGDFHPHRECIRGRDNPWIWFARPLSRMLHEDGIDSLRLLFVDLEQGGWRLRYFLGKQSDLVGVFEERRDLFGRSLHPFSERFERRIFQLADALAAQIERVADRLERFLAGAEGKPPMQDLLLDDRQTVKLLFEFLCPNIGIDEFDAAQSGVFLLGSQDFDQLGRVIKPDLPMKGLWTLVHLHILEQFACVAQTVSHVLGELIRCGRSAVLLLEGLAESTYSRNRFLKMHGRTERTVEPSIRYLSGHGMPDPPIGVGGKPDSAVRVVLFKNLGKEGDHAHLIQIFRGNAAESEKTGQRYHQTEVAVDDLAGKLLLQRAFRLLIADKKLAEDFGVTDDRIGIPQSEVQSETRAPRLSGG